jgi:AraC-like DNA-binding protein
LSWAAALARAAAGLAPRTLGRRYLAETGLHLTAWRQRLRRLRATKWLAEGRSVTAVALELGYDNVSAFIRLFRRGFGVTPALRPAGAGAGRRCGRPRQP